MATQSIKNRMVIQGEELTGATTEEGEIHDLQDIRCFCYYQKMISGTAVTLIRILANAESDFSGTDGVLYTSGAISQSADDETWNEVRTDEVAHLAATDGRAYRYARIELTQGASDISHVTFVADSLHHRKSGLNS